MKKALAIALLLALPAQAQQKLSVVPATRGALLLADGGVVDVGEGTWFSRKEVIEMGKDHADLRSQNEKLIQSAPEVPYRWVFGAAMVGFALGIIAGAVSREMVEQSLRGQPK